MLLLLLPPPYLRLPLLLLLLLRQLSAVSGSLSNGWSIHRSWSSPSPSLGFVAMSELKCGRVWFTKALGWDALEQSEYL